MIVTVSLNPVTIQSGGHLPNSDKAKGEKKEVQFTYTLGMFNKTRREIKRKEGGKWRRTA